MTPTDESAFLHDLERNVRAELAEAEASQPVDEAVRVPVDEWIFDPAEAPLEDVRLRSLLGAVESMEAPTAAGPAPDALGARADEA